MIFTVNIWVVLYACGFAMGIFMSLLFILFSKRYSIHVINIIFLFLTISLLLFFEIAEESNLVDNYPPLLGISPIVDLLIWPFLVFYVQYIIGQRNSYNWKVILYFGPFIIAFIWQIQFLNLSGKEQLAYFNAGIPLNIFILVTFKLICAIGFILYMLRMLSAEIKRFRALFPHNKKVKFLLKTKYALTGIVLVVLIIYSMFYIQYFDLLPLGDSDRIGSLIISGITYLLGALIFRNPELFLEKKYSKQVKSFFGGTESKYLETLLNLFNTKKVYLNSQLTINDVASEMELSNQQLSYLVNRQLGISFNDFVNTYRVKEVKTILCNGEHQNKTLLGLALDAGFNSKASFNRIFKDHTGFSPSDFVKKRVSNPN